MYYRSTLSGGALITLLIACQQTDGPQSFHDAPAEVKIAFQSMLDSVLPGLKAVLEDHQLHPGLFHDDSDTLTLNGHISRVSPNEAQAELYSASVIVVLHAHVNDIPVPRTLTFQFVTRFADRPWYLLTDDGYIFQLDPSENGTQLPLDAEGAIRNTFENRLEFTDWWIYREDVLKNASGSQDTVG